MSLSEHDKIILEKIHDAVSILRVFQKNNRKHRQLVTDLLAKCQEAIIRIGSQPDDETSDEILSVLVSAVKARMSRWHLANPARMLSEIVNALTRVKSIVHPDFTVPAPVLNLSDITPHKIERICFRGDDRSPDNIFRNGFLPYADGEEGIVSPFETESDNVVAFTSRFAAAVFFPFNPRKIMTYVYVFRAHQGFDVHAHGYKVFAESGMSVKLANMLFVDELMTDRILPGDIIGAAKIFRMAYDPDANQAQEFLTELSESDDEDDAYYLAFYRNRGKYEIVGYEMNPRCRLDEAEIKRVELFFQNEMKMNKNRDVSASRVALPSSGYQKNGMFGASAKQKKCDDEVQSKIQSVKRDHHP